VTFAYIASTIFDKNYYPGDYTSGVNECQVTIANNMSYTRDVPQGSEWDIRDNGLIWTEYTQLVLERARTAREGVELIGRLHERHRLSGDPGTMYGVADPNEGWVVNLAVDGQWVAKKVPDDGFHVLPNAYTIGAETDLNSPDVLHSPDVVSYAQEKGWYDPAKDGAFSFKDAYGIKENQERDYNALRLKLVGDMLSPAPVTKEKLMEVMRSAYEGTDYYKTDENGSPFGTEIRTVSRLNTEVSAVIQLRPALPKEIGTTVWWAMATAKTSPYIPWYLGAKTFPAPYQTGTLDVQSGSAYWAFRNISLLVNAHYPKTSETVKTAWDEFEKEELARQASLEAEAGTILASKGTDAAVAFLNEYSNSKAAEAYGAALDLLETLRGETARFKDAATHWAREDIEMAAALGLLNGVSDDLFSPDVAVSRGMFVTILGRLASVNPEGYAVSADMPGASDVKPDAYYAPYVAWALDEGITSGVGDGRFAPSNAISREEMCVMLYNLILKSGMEVKPELEPMAFGDAGDVSSWAVGSVNALSAVGLVKGSNGAFLPKASSTRAEAAALIARFVRSLGN
jgi:dipeptidase